MQVNIFRMDERSNLAAIGQSREGEPVWRELSYERQRMSYKFACVGMVAAPSGGKQDRSHHLSGN